MTYFLLITHCAALFPICMCLWSWKHRKNLESLFVFIQYLFIVIISLFYHTYDISEITTPPEHKIIWTILDSYQSTSIIITTLLYCLRVKPPIFYIIINLINTFVLIFILFELDILIIYVQILITIGALVIKWRTVYRYISKFYYTCLFVIIFACLSLWFYIEAYKLTYETTTYHSLWHLTIFTTAGFGMMLRYKLESIMYPAVIRDTLHTL